MLWQMLLQSSGTRKLAALAGQSNSTTPASSFSFNNVDLGAVTADRVIVVCVTASGATARTISGVTIAGNAATLVTRNSSFRKCTGIYMLAVPTGTSATVAVTFSGAVDEASVGCYSLQNWGTVTVHDSGSATVSSTAGINVSGMDTPASGMEIAVLSADDVLWSITPSHLNTNAEHTVSSATARFRTFRAWTCPSATGTTVTATATGSSDQSMSVASFS